jgi:hypothetical protein
LFSQESFYADENFTTKAPSHEVFISFPWRLGGIFLKGCDGTCGAAPIMKMMAAMTMGDYE